MTKKEIRALKNQRDAEMEDKLENLDDDFKAIEAIVNKQHRKKMDDSDDEDKKPSSSKFAKSLKALVDKPRNKFNDSKSGNKSNERPRDQKANFKEEEFSNKGKKST